MDNRNKAFDLANEHGMDREAFANYLLNDWLSGDQALESVTNFLEDEMGVDLDEVSIEELEEDLWNQPTGAPPTPGCVEATWYADRKDSSIEVKEEMDEETRKAIASMRNGEGI